MMTSLIYFQTPSSSSLPSGWELALHIWAHVSQGYADPCSRFFDHVRRSRCAWRPRSPAAPTLPHHGPGTWQCIAAGRETTSVSYHPSYRRDTRQRNNTELTCVSDGKPYQTLCDYGCVQTGRKISVLSYLMQICSLFVVWKAKKIQTLMCTNLIQITFILKIGMHLSSKGWIPNIFSHSLVFDAHVMS